MKSFLSLALLTGIAVYAWVTFQPQTVSNSPVEMKGRVAAIIDGDSFKLTSDGQVYRVELAGVDAPEIGQAYSDTSLFYLTELIDGREVRIEVYGTNDYGDIIGEVFLDQLSINRVMLREGYAWAARDEYGDKSWDGLESVARNRGLGLWRLGSPKAPWDYREELKNS